jgi:murein L,D-transpeptidase YafK
MWWVAGAAGVGVLLVACVVRANQGTYAGQALPTGVEIDRLEVFKGANRMDAYAGETLLKSYEVAIGSGGAGPKRWEGDSRTPEGRYRIDRRHRSEQFYRFLHMSYPNEVDRRRYVRLRREGVVPRGAGIGSAIGVHGQPQGVAGMFAGMLGLEWTAGCIAVSDEESEELYRAVRHNAVIEIHP